MWKNGGTMRYRSPARKSISFAYQPCARSDWAWVRRTPLGWPVVPDVNMRSDTVSPRTAPIAASASAAGTASPAARNSAHGTSGGSAGPDRTTVRPGRSTGEPGSAARSMPT